MVEDVTTAGGPVALHRRRVLIGAGAAGLAGVLAACGDDGGTSAGSGQPTGAASPDGAGEPADGEPNEPAEDHDDAAADDDAAEDEDAEENGAEDDGAEGLVAAADVPVGGGVILSDAEIVITQPSEGEFRGFSSWCTHQGCQVTDVSDGLIRCPCHGSRYFVEDGTVERGPATQALPEVEISQQDGQIVPD